MPDSFDILMDRAKAAGFELEDRSTPDVRRIAIGHGEDDDRGWIIISEDVVDWVIASKFDAFVPLGDFEAIWSSSERVIECGLSHGNLVSPPSFRLESMARIFGVIDRFDPVAPRLDLRITIPSPIESVAIQLQFASDEFNILRGVFRRQIVVRNETRSRLPVLRLEGVSVTTSDAAAALLESIGNAVLFQLDLKSDIPFFLARRQEHRLRRVMPPKDMALSAPSFRYDSEAMALYWYARTAFQIPLLGFLAFYQVLEFYFPAFSAEKVNTAVRSVLKDPRFDPMNDAQIARLLACVRPNAAGRGYGDERTQLQATIQACITPQQMRDFFETDERIMKFYSRQGKQRMPIVDTRVPVDSDGDLRPQVAQRIYDIRNRIVHTKSGGDDAPEVLLPFSREARLLAFDLLLVEHLARQALIATSRPLVL